MFTSSDKPAASYTMSSGPFILPVSGFSSLCYLADMFGFSSARKFWRKFLNNALAVSAAIFFAHVDPYNAFAEVRISNLRDFTLGSWSGSGDLYDNDDICIYNSGGTGYRITATGSGSGQAFTLSTTGGAVEYEVRFKDQAGSGGSYVQLTSGTQVSSFSGASSSSDCNSGVDLNANIKITVTATALGSAVPGSYSGTLTIVLAPN